MVLTKEPVRVVLNSYRKIQTNYSSLYALLKVRVATTPYWRNYLTLPYIETNFTGNCDACFHCSSPFLVGTICYHCTSVQPAAWNIDLLFRNVSSTAYHINQHMYAMWFINQHMYAMWFINQYMYAMWFRIYTCVVWTCVQLCMSTTCVTLLYHEWTL